MMKRFTSSWDSFLLAQVLLFCCALALESMFYIEMVKGNVQSDDVTVVLARSDALRLRTAVARALGPKEDGRSEGYQRSAPRAIGLDDEDRQPTSIRMSREQATQLRKVLAEAGF